MTAMIIMIMITIMIMIMITMKKNLNNKLILYSAMKIMIQTSTQNALLEKRTCLNIARSLQSIIIFNNLQLKENLQQKRGCNSFLYWDFLVAIGILFKISGI